MGLSFSGLGGVLFTKTQRGVLGLLFGNPEKSFYANEIVRLAGCGTGATHRELARLESAKLVTTKRIGNQKHYQASKDAPIFEELRGIVLKTFGVAGPLREALEPLEKRIQAAFIFGSVAQASDSARSDIDVMIIGDEVSYLDVTEAFAELETQVQRPVNPVIYGIDEFRNTYTGDRGFITGVMKRPKIFLIGSEDDLAQAG